MVTEGITILPPAFSVSCRTNLCVPTLEVWLPCPDADGKTIIQQTQSQLLPWHVPPPSPSSASDIDPSQKKGSLAKCARTTGEYPNTPTK